MDKEQLWDIYTRRNPRLLVGPVQFTAAGARKFFDQTWESAHRQGVANGRVLGQDEANKNNPMAGIFGGW